MFSYRFLISAFLILTLNIAFHAQTKETVLTKKFSPQQLKTDAEVFKNVTLAMHPVVGIYQSKDFYNNLFDDFIRNLNDSLTEKQFRLKTKLLVDELHCGHTEVLYSSAYYKYMNKQKVNFSPYIFLPVENQVYVFANLNKKKDSTLKTGTEITKINGIAVDSLLRYSKRFISTDGYNQTAKDFFIQFGFNIFYPALFGRPDTFSVEYKNRDTLKTLKYEAFKTKNIPPVRFRSDSLFTKYKAAKIKYRFLDEEHKTMLLQIEGFSNRKYRKAYRKVFRKLKKNNSENLIIDLRGNGGGSMANTYKLLSYLINEPETQTLKTGIKNYPYREYTKGNVWFKFTRFVFGKVIGVKKTVNDTDNFIYTIKPRKKNHFDKKVAVLINGGSFSASCLVSAYLQAHKRAVFIGQETGGAIEGCNAGVTPYYKLPNTKIRIRMPAFRIIHDVAPEITGHGILPDYKTEYTFKDFLKKRDVDLLKAKEVLGY